MIRAYLSTGWFLLQSISCTRVYIKLFMYLVIIFHVGINIFAMFKVFALQGNNFGVMLINQSIL